ncbi:MAG: hypothetical protein PVI50_03345 [Gammaproteobacteria bacterium]|jgi:hypothetical protein
MEHVIRLLSVLLLAAANMAYAAEPTFGMQGGGTVTVDPDTNRATIHRDGVTAPLWDGTHRMQDGSVLIIHQGMVVPNEPVLGARAGPEAEEEDWPVEPIVGYSPCEQLVRRVCGRGDECVDTEACDLARQLLDMEAEERDQNTTRNLTTYTSNRCLSVEKDPGLFPDCARDPR